MRMEPALRPEPLWHFCRSLEGRGLRCDTRSYYGSFRVDTKGETAAVVSHCCIFSHRFSALVRGEH